MEGIDYVSVSDGEVLIGGRLPEAVDKVKDHLQALIHRSDVKLRRGKVQTYMDADTSSVYFAALHPRKMLANFEPYLVPGRQFMLLSRASDDLSAAFAGLRVSPQNMPETVVKKWSMELMAESFQELLHSREPLKVEIRLGVLAFHSLSHDASTTESFADFLRLCPGKDYKKQFCPQLKKTNLESEFLQEGYELCEAGTCTKVGLVDAEGKTKSKVTFVDVDSGIDPRHAEEKRKELERIRRCKTPAEVLGLLPGAAAVEAKKAFFKKSLLVHPDKNVLPGAGEAMKALVAAREAAEKGRANEPLEIPNFEIGAPPMELPQMLSFTQKRQLFQGDVGKLDGELGFRTDVFAEDHVNDPKATAFLESAWKSGAIKEGGQLRSNKVYSIDSVRMKTWKLLTNGPTRVSLEEVKQKSIETCGDFGTYPEITLSSAPLDELISSGKGAQSPQDALQSFQELVSSAVALCKRLNTRC
ncbi:dnajc27-a [Symbiodinium microadriaticum]|nr:dnajc27-a [Symbiodinium microadriaticum]